MPSELILYQIILVLAGLPAGLCMGWFYKKDQLKVKKGEARQTSFFASCVVPYLFFVPLFWVFGQIAYAFAGFMVVSLITSYYSSRQVSEVS